MRPACPKCGSEAVAEILWGFGPPPTPEECAAYDRGELVHGGCIVPVVGEPPRWVCRACLTLWPPVVDPHYDPWEFLRDKVRPAGA